MVETRKQGTFFCSCAFICALTTVSFVVCVYDKHMYTCVWCLFIHNMWWYEYDDVVPSTLFKSYLCYKVCLHENTIQIIWYSKFAEAGENTGMESI